MFDQALDSYFFISLQPFHQKHCRQPRYQKQWARLHRKYDSIFSQSAESLYRCKRHFIALQITKLKNLLSWRSGKICQLPRHWQWKGSLPVQAQLCLHKLCAMCLCNAEWYMQCNAQCSVCSVQCSLKGGGSLPDTKRQFASPVQTVWYSLCSVGTVQCSV